jgi:ubiquinone/menaquinone biosynthesis C-methylase UbiE
LPYGIIKKILDRRQHILDLACGYGRLTILLAKQGYHIEGIDITPSLITEARKVAKRERVNTSFKVGDMRKLPYENESFDAIICMWNAFNELYKEKDQLHAIKEMLRVLRKGGFAFIEMRYARIVPRRYINKVAGDEIRKVGRRITVGKTSGIESMPQYVHNKNTVKKLMKKAGNPKYTAKLGNFGGRKRFLLQFWR